jgi:hypothetical protein
VRLAGAHEPRVGRPLEGAIQLRDAPPPGDEFDLVLTGGRTGAAPAWRAGQKVRARQGVQGMTLPFRFEVPATAPPSGIGTRWRLEFAPAGSRAWGRSWIDLKLAPAPAHEQQAARTAAAEASPAPASAGQGQLEHIETLWAALGGRMTQAQRERLRTRLAEVPAANAAQLDMLRKLTPQHVKLIKWGVIGFVALFFVLPFVLSVLAVALGGLFG